MKKDELEIIILGTIMKMAKARDKQTHDFMLQLQSEDFQGMTQLVFLHMQKSMDRNESLTRASLQASCDDSELRLFIGDWAQSPFSSHNLQFYIDSLRTINKINSYQDMAQNILDIIQTKPATPNKMVEILEGASTPSYMLKDINAGTTAKQAFNEFVDYLMDESPLEIEKTGFDNLDMLLQDEGQGMAKGSLVGVVGATKNGKSALAGSIFANRLEQNTMSLCFTMEISVREFLINIIAQKTKTNRGEWKKKKATDQAYTRLTAMAGENTSPDTFIVYDNSDITLSFIVQQARLKARKMPVKTILVDYLTLIKVDTQKNESSFSMWGRVVTTLRHLAKELDCIIILVSQVNRNVANRADKRPQVNDIRDTSQLQYDCHLLLGTFVDQEIDQFFVDQHGKQMEVKILLNRNGGAGLTCYFNFEQGNLVEKGFREGAAYVENAKNFEAQPEQFQNYDDRQQDFGCPTNF